MARPLRLLRLVAGGWPYLAPAGPLLGLRPLPAGAAAVAHGGQQRPTRSLAALLGLAVTAERHAVLVAAERGGCVALAVEAVEAITELEAGQLQRLPPLLASRCTTGWVLGLVIAAGQPLLVIDLAAIAAGPIADS